MRKSVQQRMFKAIGRWRHSGLNQKAWCEKNDIAYSSFHYWYKRYRSEVRPQNGEEPDGRFVPLVVEPSPATGAWCDVSLPDGKKLAFHHPVDAGFLRSLIG
jgi:hypothetical protein